MASGFQTDLILNSGQTFSNLTISTDTHVQSTQQIVECICSCGAITFIKYAYLKYGSTKSCGCLKNKPSSLWKGHGGISGKYWSALRFGAKQRNIEFEIAIQEAWVLYQQQEARCLYTGLELTLARNYGSKKEDNYRVQTASLDRIESSVGYTLNNVCWVHKEVNLMKGNLTHERFLELCKLITTNHVKL